MGVIYSISTEEPALFSLMKYSHLKKANTTCSKGKKTTVKNWLSTDVLAQKHLKSRDALI